MWISARQLALLPILLLQGLMGIPASAEDKPAFPVEITHAFGTTVVSEKPGRVATVAIDRMAFLVPVSVGAQLSFYTQALEIGRSSIQMMVEVWSDDPLSNEWRKVTEAVFVFVAIDGSGRTRPVPPRRG